ncbi:MAG: PEP-CTERM sorting domain-containing protein [Verrucomicrobiota bacterium]|nr:PEP-CTERM sorting domain-containing protein [Limisphaera sp.]MDW8382307.1 PEP-CTERM sorting domain-containing protein [Verrucomicrobiota bacterium]
MKTLVSAAVLCGLAANVFAQGTIIFNNRVTGQVVAPVYGPLGPTDTTALTGNTPSGFPAGSQNYGGRPLLAGAGYYAQLFAGPQGTPEASLLPVPGTLVTFRTGGFAGFIAAPTEPVSIPGVPQGQVATMQLRAWENQGGSISTWAAAEALWLSGTIAAGKSLVFDSPALAGGITPPPNLLGLQSFNIYYIPEPGTLALLGLGALGLMVFRRK